MVRGDSDASRGKPLKVGAIGARMEGKQFSKVATATFVKWLDR
jgi:hypothetical protein